MKQKYILIAENTVFDLFAESEGEQQLNAVAVAHAKSKFPKSNWELYLAYWHDYDYETWKVDLDPVLIARQSCSQRMHY